MRVFFSFFCILLLFNVVFIQADSKDSNKNIESKNVDSRDSKIANSKNIESKDAHSPSLAEGAGGWVNNHNKRESHNTKIDSNKKDSIKTQNLDSNDVTEPTPLTPLRKGGGNLTLASLESNKDSKKDSIESNSQDSKNIDSKDSIESKPQETPKTPQKQSGFNATYAERYAWKYGSTLLGFFAQNNIPESTYYNLAPEDKELVADVKTDSDIYVLRDSKGALLQAYLPLNADMQVKIFYDFNDNAYKLEITPILSLRFEQKVIAKIQDGGGPSKALYNATQDGGLNQEFLNAYKARYVVQKGDRVAVIYTRKFRLGKNIGTPDVKSIAIESKGKFYYLFGYKNRYYDADGKEMANFFLITPVKYRRISSKFSSGRKHPVLGYVRPHYGVDFSATTGTPVYAAGEGIIAFSGVKGGYGKVIEINHAGGIRTLYAHLSKIGKASKIGARVRQGTYIGNVGSTGLSTGPHLHFGVYKNNKPINPLGQIKTQRSELSGNDKKQFLEYSRVEKDVMDNFLQSADLTNNTFYITKDPLDSPESHDEEEHEDSNVGQDSTTNKQK
ncbi:peptidoglycan DD-metalloendopeptidase family protein [Helicobacter saguini]|uniref:M23 family metallopeptidase n=1 Tax=Helicobacter saguini TaxID=1548018 RepID=A0A347VJI6_9HELI|nr:peptidoglycan DD-metalloendopeptidase family protein [Helicobacter saguini]MWV63107.1 peptidoglycan DD-metalloendopeptidase family protein [Helicobacter saguini]MWV66223.1 peptidoglycan DD-metalloendopeptidase family protein [Helicobacter saguini]MWV68574.1 peptidoglycan DD-metalloendopeptidase family protein [Helicobacter saguini]MWV71873.1 peptidoglycan DD-metalloendopeptidase family protein [Helicobacter saguini]TLD95889.1 M23 family metallopeptidase [Helicobacter saguini]